MNSTSATAAGSQEPVQPWVGDSSKMRAGWSQTGRASNGLPFSGLGSSGSSGGELSHWRGVREILRDEGLFVPRFSISLRVRQHTLRNALSLCYNPRRIAFTPSPIVVKQETDIMAAMLKQSIREVILDESLEERQRMRESCLAISQMRGFA